MSLVIASALLSSLLLAAPVAAQSPLLRAALAKRAEVERIRSMCRPAPEFTGRGYSGSAPVIHAEVPKPQPPPEPEAEPPPEPEAEPSAEPEIDEEALRERLLDLEADLVSIGASALPLAVRNPNRFRHPLAAARIRAEMAEIRRTLERR